MNLSIAFSGPAGGGVNTAGLLLAQLLTQKGYKILVDKEYASIIKGDNNSIIVYISDDKPFISKKLDYFICFDDYAISKNEKIYDLQNIVNLKTYAGKYKNVPAFGVSIKILEKALDIDFKQAEEMLSKFFQGEILETSKEEFKKGYELSLEVPLLEGEGLGGGVTPQGGSNQQLFFGNEILAKGAMEAGLDRYSAYPMTPASSLIDVISKDHRVTFHQGEDEIAVSMSMLGAKFAGKRAMCGTSGGGFALMTESISYSHQAEIGGVYIFSQRDGPSTGTPTFTAQGDLDFALNASFGETYPIVMYPDTFENGYNLIGKALNRSDIYQHPVVVMTDKQFSESYLSIDPKNLKPAKIDRGDLVKGSENFARYQLTKSGISPYSIPGTQNGEFIASSYEHDEYGATNEDPDMKAKMTNKRAQKMKTFIEKEFNDDFYGYEVINPNAKKFFVTMGFNRYTLEDYISRNSKENGHGKLEIAFEPSEYGLIIITVLQPLDPRLKFWLQENEKNIDELTFVEMNHTGLLQKLITNECNLKSQSRNKKLKNIRKIELYPIFKEDIK